MKTISFILLIFSLTNATFAKEVVTKKVSKSKTSFKAQHYPRIMCNQKSIPMKVEQTLNAHLLTVTFTAEEKIENFTLKTVRGIDGVSVSKFQEIANQKLDSGEAIESSVELSDFDGLVYVVFDVALTINGISTDRSIPVAVGSLSATQISARSKNIKEVKNKSQQKDGINSISVPAKKIHEMKLE